MFQKSVRSRSLPPRHDRPPPASRDDQSSWRRRSPCVPHSRSARHFPLPIRLLRPSSPPPTPSGPADASRNPWLSAGVLDSDRNIVMFLVHNRLVIHIGIVAHSRIDHLDNALSDQTEGIGIGRRGFPSPSRSPSIVMELAIQIFPVATTVIRPLTRLLAG